MRWIAASMMLLLLPACAGWQGEQHRQAGACKIVVTDFGDMRIDTITADSVSIYLDGNSSLGIERLTAKRVETKVDGYGRVKTGYSEAAGSE